MELKAGLTLSSRAAHRDLGRQRRDAWQGLDCAWRCST